MVKREPEAHGFRVTDIKRVNRKEFDVVAVKNDVIFNFPCKNNWIDLRRIESDSSSFVKLTNVSSRNTGGRWPRRKDGRIS
jgi:hypothetical protein